MVCLGSVLYLEACEHAVWPLGLSLFFLWVVVVFVLAPLDGLNMVVFVLWGLLFVASAVNPTNAKAIIAQPRVCFGMVGVWGHVQGTPEGMAFDRATVLLGYGRLVPIGPGSFSPPTLY